MIDNSQPPHSTAKRMSERALAQVGRFIVSIFVNDSSEVRSEEQKDFLLSLRVIIVIIIITAVIFAVNRAVGGSSENGAYHRFLESLPLLMIASLFGVFGATTRYLSSDNENIRTRQFRNFLAGGIVGAVSFLFVKSKVLLQIAYDSDIFEREEVVSAGLDPFGSFLIAFFSGMFAPEIVGYARLRASGLAGEVEKPSVKSRTPQD